MPNQAVRDGLGGFGLGDWMVESLVNLFADYRRSGTDGYAAQMSETVERFTGRPARTLDQLLSEAPPGPHGPSPGNI